MKSVFLDDSVVNITPENERVKALSVIGRISLQNDLIDIIF